VKLSTKELNDRELTAEEQAMKDRIVTNIAKKREEKSAEQTITQEVSVEELAEIADITLEGIEKEEPAKEQPTPFFVEDAQLTQTGLQCMTPEKRNVIECNVFTMKHAGNGKYFLSYGDYKLTEPKYEGYKGEFSFKMGNFIREVKSGKFFITFEVKELVGQVKKVA